MTLALAPAPTVCTEASCQRAASDVSLCECSCGGLDHGLEHRAGREAARQRVRDRIARTGNPFLGAANHTDEEPF